MQNNSTAQISQLEPRQTLASPPVTSCPYGSGRFEVSDKGVYFHGKDKEGQEQAPQWVCSPLHVVAKTRDEKSGEWGRMLEWLDDDGKKHQWAMPLELLEGDGSEVRRELAGLGLHISPNQAARNLMSAYIKVWPVEARACCVDRLGWHGEVFVTPSESIGQTNELVVFQNAHAIEPAFSISGNEYEWRDSVAAMAQGNSRPVLAISVAFAGPLAHLAGVDAGGFHFRGASSSGKSTVLKLAASVWGKPSSYVRLWHSTTNGLEGLAALHNDGLLILDEISQMDPAAAGNAVYLLANGQGKARANRNGRARAPQLWRNLLLSAGEESLSAIMARAGKKMSAGQGIRLADIEADAGVGMGIFETLNGQPSGAALASALKDASTQFHGAVGRKWLAYLVVNQATLPSFIADSIKAFLAQAVPAGAAGQVERVAVRFALVAVAGELATRYKLTGWTEGEATRAALICFAAWLEGYGGNGNHEERAILAQVREFFETQGASRFEDIKTQYGQHIPNRAGFYRYWKEHELEENELVRAREFLVLGEPFRREICKGFDERMVKRVLINAGFLLPNKEGNPTQNVRLPGLGSTKVYVIRYKGEAD
jgi:putative DNA primase/helicase